MKEILITSSVLILAIILLRFLFRNKVSRQLIYGAWLLVALRLLIPVQFGNLNFSVLTPAKPVTNIITDIAQRPVSGPSREEAYSNALRDYLSQGSPVFIPEVQEQVESQIQHGRPEQEVYDEVLETNKPESILLPEISQEIETKVSQTAVPTVGQIALAIWVAGMAAMAGWFAFVNLTFRRKLRASAKAFDLPESKVPVKVNPVLTSPCLFGLWKPTVYMTPGCVDNAQTRHHVLTHELTHLHHRDHIWSWVRCLCLCIYWFNPLVWVAASLSRRDCELACDEAALKKLGEGERLAYGKTLLDMVSSVPAPGQLLETATAMHETKKQLKERMKCIVKKPKVFLTAAIILLVVLTVITGCTFSGALDAPNGTAPGNTQPTTAPTTSTTTQPTTVPTTTTTTPPTTVPTTTTVPNADVATFQELFTYNEEERNPYYFALGFEFTDPKEIGLYDFFRGSLGPDTATDAEMEELKQHYSENWLEKAKLYRLPKNKMNAELQRYFGISLEDLPDTAYRNLTYLESSDCYCFVDTTSNVYVKNYEVQSVEYQDDGTVKVEYISSASTVGKHIVMLKPNGGDFQILSNKWFVFDDPELAFFHEMFHGISMPDRETRNYYNYALGQEYASPMELNLRNFFGNGFKGEKTATQAELTELKPYLENSFWGYAGAGDFHRLPKDKMEEELQKCFGISLADLPESAFADLIYLESTDSYCFYATGMQGETNHFEPKAVEYRNGGTVQVIYSKFAYPKWDFVVTLQPTDNGYQILSNTYLPGTTEDPEVMRYVDNAFLKVESFASDPAKALSMEFHDDNRISVRYALESTGRKGTLILKPQGVSLVIISNTLDS
ncbi:MAG: M56 family metallopeptidase [Ruminococcaceae bacterium]|nr:M56 family metallopeptidase [Oscillospiraceae bacterium]